MSLRCNVGKKTHREMLRIKRSVSAGYSQVCSLISYNQVQLTSNCFLVNSDVEEAVHVPNVYHSYIKRWCKKTGVCEVVTWNVQGTELPEECDDESVGEDKVEFVHEMLCLEDLPERESKTSSLYSFHYLAFHWNYIFDHNVQSLLLRGEWYEQKKARETEFRPRIEHQQSAFRWAGTSRWGVHNQRKIRRQFTIMLDHLRRSPAAAKRRDLKTRLQTITASRSSVAPSSHRSEKSTHSAFVVPLERRDHA
ncbi:hypothetical protein DY000_02026873 [Brassica cretica]|uniref:Uncharacterized protein n=1 Tax=Brassica cretica TaxID=69181 RepID=A0ABQ7ED69_BRACR|nr:hypothetical protein DY000_02026873 [Brassica cretica]